MTTIANNNQINANSSGGSYVLTTSDRKTKNLFFLGVLGLVVIVTLISAFFNTIYFFISSEVLVPTSELYIDPEIINSLGIEGISRQEWQFLPNFLVAGLSLALFSILAGVITIPFSLVVIQARRMGILTGGRRINYFLLKMLNGKFGKIIDFFPMINVSGEWYLEEQFNNAIEFSEWRNIFKEIFVERWYDTLIFPVALFGVIYSTLDTLDNTPIGIYINPILILPLSVLIVIMMLLIYFPLIWSLEEGGFKNIKTSREKGTESVQLISSAYREVIGISVGIGGLISITSNSLQILGSITWFEGVIVSIFLVPATYSMILVFFLPGISVIALNYLENYHLSTVRYLREQSAKDLVIKKFGSVKADFIDDPRGVKYMKNSKDLL